MDASVESVGLFLLGLFGLAVLALLAVIALGGVLTLGGVGLFLGLGEVGGDVLLELVGVLAVAEADDLIADDRDRARGGLARNRAGRVAAVPGSTAPA